MRFAIFSIFLGEMYLYIDVVHSDITVFAVVWGRPFDLVTKGEEFWALSSYYPDNYSDNFTAIVFTAFHPSKIYY